MRIAAKRHEKFSFQIPEDAEFEYDIDPFKEQVKVLRCKSNSLPTQVISRTLPSSDANKRVRIQSENILMVNELSTESKEDPAEMAC